MSKALFITATGTDVGKTYVTALMAKKLTDAGLSAGYYKAALSGAKQIGATLIPEDAQLVQQIAGLCIPAEQTVSYILKAPCSPHLAARFEGNFPQLSKIQADFQLALSQCDFLTMEGSGGIICPLCLEERVLFLDDVVKALGLHAILVADSGVGTINATLLTVHYARVANLAIKGIVLNRFDPTDPVCLDNKEVLERLSGLPILCCVQPDATEFPMDVSDLADLYSHLT